MVSIAPFRGYVYNQDEISDHGGRLVAPPYDVLSLSQREAYYSGHPHNFLNVDLGKALPGEPEMAWHARSASILQSWFSEGVLVRTPKPSIYVMETEFEHPLTGRRQIRRGFVCLMRLEAPGKDARIRLHEQTFSFHKEERLDLMEQTRCQLSPIFGFFPDAEKALLNALASLAGRAPDMALKDTSGQIHKVVCVDDPETVEIFRSRLADRTVYIADGHHRYMTALNYRDRMLSAMDARGEASAPDGALDWVMTYLCPMSDPGLCVLPTHRILRSLDLSNEEILARLNPIAETRVIGFSESGSRQARDTLAAKLREDCRKGLTVFGLYLNGADFCCFIKIREKVKEAVADRAPERSSLSQLDVSILTDMVLGEALGLTEADMDDPARISYISDADEAFRLIEDPGCGGQGCRAAFILNPTRLAEILKVTESGYVMPRKATYFYPKVTNGLVINLVDPSESVVAQAQGEGPA
ncbi:MAG: DUF1015 domain-containing protein [Deltaproteobacteria bacterium]|jgi:uncharacterized protein (DUF1015 family)|nr:DUF1015 domain-containing protein [Deltaproteobacteria bacterium]